MIGTASAVKLVGAFLLAGFALAACGKQKSAELAPPESSIASGRVEDQFGKEFGKAFRADPNSAPANVTEGDVVPVSLTTEPVLID